MSRFRDVVFRDKNTGEILDGVPILYPNKKHSPLGKEGFVVVGQISAAETLAKSNLDGVALRVLWQLISEIGFNNYLDLNQSRSAKKMGLAPPNFNRALKQLIAAEIVLEHPKNGGGKVYSLNPVYGWKGDTKSHVEALEEYEDNRTRNTSQSINVQGGAKVTITVEPLEVPGNSRN